MVFCVPGRQEKLETSGISWPAGQNVINFSYGVMYMKHTFRVYL
jgi:hypothetical protein